MKDGQLNPEPPATATNRNASRNVGVWLRPVGIYLIAASLFVLLEALLFRTGVYAKIVAPVSSTGMFEEALREELNRKPSGRSEVLILGDSRIAEGFSAPIANGSGNDRGYFFANSSVPGGTPRSCYYQLRDLDPTRLRYSAVVIPLESYEDIDNLENLANRTLDLHYVVARLRLSDVFDFTSSFEDARVRIEVFRGSVFKGFVYQRDVQAFIENPVRRLNEVMQWRAHGWDWHNGYKGRSESLAGLSVDWQTKTIRMPENLDPASRARIKAALLAPRAPQTGKLGVYRRRWLGRIVELYRGTRTRVVFLALPRGPVPRPGSPEKSASHSARDLANLNNVFLLPEEAFRSLEHPEYYFDNLHLNSKGRELFSLILARLIPQVLGPGQN